MIPPPDAATWARTVPADAAGARLLEAHVLHRHGHPFVHRLGCRRVRSDAAAPSPAVQRLAEGASFAAFLVPLAGLTVFLAGGDVPLSGGRTLPTTSDGFAPGTQLTLARVCFWVTAAMPLVAAVHWWRAGRWRAVATAGLLAWTGGCAALAAIVLPQRGADPWGTTALPMHLTWAGCLVVVVLLLTASRAASQGPPTVIRDAPHPPAPDAIAELVRDLPARDRATSFADREAALAVLVERGLVPAATRDAARDLPLGRLVETWPED
ncbi:MAG TPA: hypothetical protein VGE77_05700 [Nocardioides sp.]